MKAHMRQSPNCVFAQELDITSKETPVAIPTIALADSAPAEHASTNCIASSPQIPYLTIEDLYHKQKALVAKSEELEPSSLSIQSELQLAASSEPQTELKSSKSDEFTISLSSSSASVILCSESIIKSDAALVASSVFIPASESSNPTSLRSTSLCPAPAILLASQSSNQLAAQIPYQHTVMAPSSSYDKRPATFTKWPHTSPTSKALIQAEFRHTPTKLSLDCTTCRRCGLILED